METSLPTLFDFLNDVYYKKSGDLLSEKTQKEYNIFMINRFMSANIDTLMYAQELNQYSKISKEEHYKYLTHALPKKKRFGKFLKEKKNDMIVLVQEYYSCSYVKAKEIYKMLNKEQLEHIQKYLYKGGK